MLRSRLMVRFASRTRFVAPVVAVVVAASVTVTVAGFPQWRAPWEAPDTSRAPGIAVAPVAGADRPTWLADGREVRGTVPVIWPAGTASVPLPSTSDLVDRAADPAAPRRVNAGTLPVSVAALPMPATAERQSWVDRVDVRVLDRAATGKVGVRGVVLTVSRADRVPAAGQVEVSLDYTGFGRAYGGDWATRLRLVRLPACALTTPDAAGCTTGTPLPTRNEATTGTLRASVTLAADGGSTVLAAAAAPAGQNGDYTATSLSPSSTWQVSQQTGDFTWSYPLRMPPAVQGPAPELALAYSSGDVDGRTGGTNSQGSWIGDGWQLWPGFIERQFKSCPEDKDDVDGDAPNNKSGVYGGDQCWFSDNATLSLNGRSTELVRDGNVWRGVSDDGSRVERVTDPTKSLGDHNGEYWLVITPDGTKYHFGRNKRTGWTSGKELTNSTWTTQVYGNHPGEPGHHDKFADSRLEQTWRWNLDYVVDPHRNTMTYFYEREGGAYAREADKKKRTTYTRAGWLERIEYGSREDTEYSAKAAARVVFEVAERCSPGATCNTDTPASWPDTPWDQYCKAEPCADDTFAPTYWTQKRLSKIRTEVYSGSGDTYQPVEEWTLRHEFLNAGTNGTEGVPMWLRGLTRSGKVTTAGGAAVTDPEIVFSPGADPLPNRVDGPADNRSRLNRWRIQIITTESGAQIAPTYSAIQCTRSALPKPESNTQRCFPQYYAPEGQDATLDWFHRYRVERVDVHDQTGGSTSMQTNFAYLDAPAWHFDNSELVKPKKRTWGQFRGYGKVQVREGDSKGTQTVTEYLYLRGMDGDKQPSGVRDESVTDSRGVTWQDHDAFQGHLLEEKKLDGTTVVSGTISEPWKRGPLATSGPLTSWMTNTSTTRAYTRLESGALRWTRSTQTLNDDNLPTQVDDRNDESTSDDDTCTRTEYARNGNPDVWLLDRVKRTETVGVTCATTAAPGDVLSEQRTYYDNPASAFGTVPVKGDVVKVEQLRGFSGTTRLYDLTERSVYDANGRVVEAYDALNRKTATTYTPTNAGPVTQTVVVNPLQHKVTTTFATAWHLPSRTVDANGIATNLAYDGLGRLKKVWQAGRAPSELPDLAFDYLVRNNAPTAVTARKLLPTKRVSTDPHYQTDPDYKVSVTLYDGWLRERQVQNQSPVQGRVITDTRYDSRGLKSSVSRPYYDTTNARVDTTLVAGPGQPVVPATTEYTYDGAGRQTAEILNDQGAEKWRTTTRYGGDRTHLIPPAGGTASTTVTDARGNTVRLLQYRDRDAFARGESPGYDTTTYTYTRNNELASLTDPAGNTWRYGYDLRGRKVRHEDPDKGATVYEFDAAGQQTSASDARNVKLVTTYDALGRKTSLREGSATGPPRVGWTYDTLAYGKGKPVASIRYDSAGNQFVSEVTGYDTAGRATGTRVTIPDTALTRGVSGTWAFGTTYKVDGQPSTTTVPAFGGLPAETTVHNYNSVGAPTTMVSGLGVYVRSVVYNEVGTLTQRVLNNAGRQVSLTYDVDNTTGRITGTTASREGASDALKLGYRYDAVGNLTRIADTTHGLAPDNQCFRYDALRRMTEAWTPASGDCTAPPSEDTLGGAAKYWHSYTYDITGNRKTETQHVTGVDTVRSYAYPAPGTAQPHALSAVTTTDGQGSRVDTYRYNGAGDTTERILGGDTQTLAWDPEGRLSSVRKGTQSTDYLYDSEGNRLIRKSATGTTLYLPGGAELTVPAAGGTAVGTRYYRHLDVSIAVRTPAGLKLTVTDHHNTGEVQLDATTLAMERRRTTPFGGIRAAAGTWVGDKGFVNGTVDDTGLTHLGAREYDPALGRFLSVDPVIDHEDPQQLHGYAYGNNAPATFTDPDGLLFGSLWKKAKSTVSSAVSTATDAVASAATSAGKATWNFVKDTAKEIKEDPLKFATQVAVGIAVAAAVAAVCSTGVGCVILAGAVAGAASAGSAYGVDVAQGEKEFSPKELATEMAVGGIAGGATAGLGVGASKVGSKLLGRTTKGCTHSFTPATLVVLADGSYKPIGQVALGDEVRTTDPETGRDTDQPVVALWAHTDAFLTELTVELPDGGTDTLRTTQSHPFWDETAGAWTDAGALVAGHRLRTPDGALVTVTAVRNHLGRQDMRDLTVGTVHTYYVVAGATPVLVHNCPAGGPSGAGKDLPDKKGPYVGKHRIGDIDPTVAYRPPPPPAPPRSHRPFTMRDRFRYHMNEGYNREFGGGSPSSREEIINKFGAAGSAIGNRWGAGQVGGWVGRGVGYVVTRNWTPWRNKPI